MLAVRGMHMLCLVLITGECVWFDTGRSSHSVVKIAPKSLVPPPFSTNAS
jgi:hypothetical protein